VALALKKMLPRYMLPNVIEALEMMPLTANGKINRQLLKESCQKLGKGLNKTVTANSSIINN
jgi:acyl-coenzyme A synthetase/AMP-(fatty) acid ligase